MAGILNKSIMSKKEKVQKKMVTVYIDDAGHKLPNGWKKGQKISLEESKAKEFEKKGYVTFKENKGGKSEKV